MSEENVVEKVAVVTGANRGIGLAIVKGLCKKFNGIVFLTSRDVKKGEAAVADLRANGLSVRYHQLDITDLESIETFKEFIVDNHGGIDVLVNNAAVCFRHDASEPLDYQAEETLKTNYFGLFNVCSLLLPIMNQGAQIVNLCGHQGHLSKIPSPDLRSRMSANDLTFEELTALMNQYIRSTRDGKNFEMGWGGSPYSVSKVGVAALTRLYQRYVDNQDPCKNISVNCVHPGWCNTGLTSDKGPLTPEEGAVAPLFLATEPHGYKGEYVWRDCKVCDWCGGGPPLPF